MDPVSSASATVNQTPQATSTPSNTLSQQDFLNLLITQLQYQDPTDPMDDSEMVDEMAQIQNVTALQGITQLLQNMQTSNSLQGVELIGHEVEANGNSLSIDSQGNVSAGAYQLASPGQVTIQIFDANGNLVNTINGGETDTSPQTFTWNGENQQGVQEPAGNYTFQVSAVDSTGQSIQVSTSCIGTVSGISFENGVTYLNIGSTQVNMSDVIAILS